MADYYGLAPYETPFAKAGKDLVQRRRERLFVQSRDGLQIIVTANESHLLAILRCMVLYGSIPHIYEIYNLAPCGADYTIRD